MKNLPFILLLLTTGFLGCSQKLPVHASSEKEVVLAKTLSLYRKKPHIWPAKGTLLVTRNELHFIPTPYYGVINVHGSDTSSIKLDSIEQLEENQWMLLFPFRLTVRTKGKSYSFVTVRRAKLVKEIQQLRD